MNVSTYPTDFIRCRGARIPNEIQFRGLHPLWNIYSGNEIDTAGRTVYFFIVVSTQMPFRRHSKHCVLHMGSSVSIQRPRVSSMGFRGRFLSSQSFREITLISTVMSFSRGIRMRSSLEFILRISSSPWSLWKSDVVTGEPRQLSSHRGGPCRSVVCKLDLGTKPRDSSDVGTFGS